jgi:molybdopterin converting factor small subunit
MIVRVKLHAILRKFLPPDARDNTVVMELSDGATVSDVIARLRIPANHASMLVSGDDYLEPETPLRDGQEVSIFPPLAGGAHPRNQRAGLVNVA